ncbi:unnamed protein product [Eruca vesicaria subsp. sativa]|uniref:Uncharacterized protein n=1 Tax=Eruca vesicaria subsp. sativa TaxID=29727 RepID=A0ABC8JTI3_ERUVS|nr:unnamed protein product [Eruca vesicaria subsp. sativa]
MNTNNHGLLLLSLVFIFSLLYFPYLGISETPCPYPCYPPPIGNLPPPTFNYPYPAGNLPNYPSPPYVGGGASSSIYGPPPPDAILPYFPYYFRKPPHQTDQTSSSPLVAVSGKLTVRIVAMSNIVVVGVLCNIW